MNNEKVYPWCNLPWDLALADGLEPGLMFNSLDAIEDKDSDEWWLEAGKLESAAKTELGAMLWRDICMGKLLVRKSNGDPLNGDPKLFEITGGNTPHLTRDEGNQWLKDTRYLETWEPKEHTNVVTGQNASPQVSGTPKPAKDWRFEVQEEAYKLWIRLRAAGCNPSINSICQPLADWCIQKDIRGGKGQNPTAGTIRNAVLGAGKWTPPELSVAAAKQHLERHPEIASPD